MNTKGGLRFTLGLIGCFVAHAGFAQDSFRVDDLDLKDPHLFGSPFTGLCIDVTSNFNALVQSELQEDGDSDGNLDSSVLFEFLPLDRNAATNLFESGTATCTAPAASTVCGNVIGNGLVGDATLQSAGTCLSPFANTFRAAYGPITSPAAPCFASPVADVTFSIGGIPLVLRDTQVAATFADTPTNTLSNGLMRGFLRETDADATTIPASYPVIGGRPLSSVLPGGTGSCSTNDDRDTHEGVSGWWFYFNLSATRATVATDPFADGFSNSFE